MSGFTNFIGAVAGQVATRVILNKVESAGLGQREPRPYDLPVIVPGSPDAEALPTEVGVGSGRFVIPTWAFLTGYGALLWYAAKATTPVVDLPDLGEGDLAATQRELFDPEQQEIDFSPRKTRMQMPRGREDLLFPSLKREITHLDTEDVATSDDPIEACLERAGWKLERVDELRETIFEKEQVDLFTEPDPLTRSEGELLEAIENCMQKLEAQYGSLEAAGVGCSVCDGGDPALGVVQREMFDPEQEELTLYPGPTAPKHMQAKEGPDTFWFFIAKGFRKAKIVTQEQIDANPDWYFFAEKDNKGKLYQIEADTKVKALRKLHDQLKAAREYAKEYGQKQNKFTPWFHSVEDGGKGYRIIPNIMAHPDLGAVQREMFDPEQIEMDLPIAHKTVEEISSLYEYLDTLEPGEPANILDACIWILGSENCGAAQTDHPAGGVETVIHLVKHEGYYFLDDLRKAYKSGDKASIPQHRKTRYLGIAS